MDQTLEKEQVIEVETVETVNAVIDSLKTSFNEADEKSYTRKVDWRIMPILWGIYFFQLYDKSVMNQAALFGLTSDLHLTSYSISADGEVNINQTKFSNVTMIFYVGFIVSALPFTLTAQRFRMGRMISFFIVMWGLILLTTPSVKGYQGLMVNRLFLGLVEGPVQPILSVYIAFIYTRQQQSLRASIMYCGSGFASMFSGLISYAFGTLSGPVPGWHYIYYFIGSLSVVFGLIIFVTLPDDVEKWSALTEKEKNVYRYRKELNKTEMNIHIEKDQLLEAFTSHTFYVSILIAFFQANVSVLLSSFSSVIVLGFGFSALDTLSLSVPFGFFYVLCMVGSGYICRKFNNLIYVSIIIADVFVMLGALLCWQLPQSNKGGKLAGMLLLSVIGVHVFLGYYMAMTNTAGTTKKSITHAAIFMSVGVGSITGSLLFSSTPGPKYNGIFIGCTAFIASNIVLSILSRAWLIRVNHKRDSLFGSNTTTHLASEHLSDKKNPDFRYMY